jgi:hypothetical protein
MLSVNGRERQETIVNENVTEIIVQRKMMTKATMEENECLVFTGGT